MATSKLVRYDSKAFPRLELLLTRLSDVMDMAKIVTLQSPHLRFVCDETFAVRLQSTNECSKFSVKGIHGKCLRKHEVCQSSLIVTVCILQPDESGKLTTKDIKLLERLRRSEPDHDINTVIYIVNTNKCTSATLKHCSEEISKTMEPLSLVNTIFNRLFEIQSPEIPVRISLFFEKTLLDKLPIKNTNTESLKQILMSQRFKEESTEILVTGPLEEAVCKTFLRQNAFAYEWQGEQYLRLPWHIRRVKHEVKKHLCECLSKAIATALVRHLDEHLRTHNISFANDFEQMIDLSVLKYDNLVAIITTLLTTMFVLFLGTITGIIAIGATLIFSVNVADFTFRFRIANTVHECIMQKRNEIIEMVLHRFGEDCWNYINKICNVLNEFGKRNKSSILFHEYKTITERNLEIKAFGLFGNTIKIYILNTERNEGPIRKYLRKYGADSQFVHICEHHEITVAKYLFKSGNKVVVDLDLQVQYGTVSFPMKDKENRYYCATCKHATLSSSFGIQTDAGEILPAESYYNACDFDFSLLKFKIKNIVCEHGIRTEQNKFVSGKVLENDIMPNIDDIVYKWGATTGLTKGHCKGVLCTRKLENGKYDMETFIIEGINEDFARGGDSGSLVCITPDSVVYTSHMAAFILIGKLLDFDQKKYTNLYTCYKVSVPLMEMENNKQYSNIKPCF